MTSQTSLFNMGIYKNNLKRFKWGSFLYFIILFLASVMPLIMTDDIYLNSALNTAFSISIITTFFVPVVVVALHQRKIHEKRQSVFIHSLPVSKKSVFITDILSSLTLMFIPVVLTGVIFYITTLFKVNEAVSFLLILKWMGMTVFSLFIMYSVSLLCSYLTGNTIVGIALTYIVNAVPLFLVSAINQIYRRSFLGFCENRTIYETVEGIMPLTKISNYLRYAFDSIIINPLDILTYVLTGILVIVLSYIIYSKRKAETAGDTFSFKSIGLFTKYFLTFTVGIGTLAMFLGGVREYTVYIWLFILTIVTFIALDMIIRKSVKFKNFKGYIIFALCFVALFSVVKFDLVNYENRVPNPQKVKAVALNTNGGYFAPEFKTTNHDTINLVTKLHKSIISNQETRKRFYDQKQGIYDYTNNEKHPEFINISYTMNSNSEMVRYYEAYLTDEDIKLLNEIYKDNLIIKSQFKLFNLKLDNIESASAESFLISNGSVTTDKKVIEELLNAVKKDLLSRSYEDLQNRRPSAAVIFLIKDRLIGTEQYRIDINYNYKNTMNVIKKYDLFNGVKITPNDVNISLSEENEYNITDEKDKEYILNEYLYGRGEVIREKDNDNLYAFRLVNSKHDGHSEYYYGNINNPKIKEIVDKYKK